jgi:hypothetical protein
MASSWEAVSSFAESCEKENRKMKQGSIFLAFRQFYEKCFGEK